MFNAKEGTALDSIENIDKDLARTMVRHRTDPRESFPRPEELRPGSSRRMLMRAKFEGYAMALNAWSDYAACVILMVHALMALIHSVVIVWRGRTSGAWDTILGLLVLCQISKPPEGDLLVNTSAGLRSLKTTRLMASVEE